MREAIALYIGAAERARSYRASAVEAVTLPAA